MPVSSVFRLGIDLGGTKTEGVVLGPGNVEIFRLRIDTETEGGYQHVLGRIAWLYRRLCESIQGEEHTLGIATPGSISAATGLLKNCNATVLNGNPLGRDLLNILHRKFLIENDANCFALAEASAGAGIGYRNVLGIVIGTGCGAGIVVEGKLLEGLHRIAGEWGHMSIDPSGAVCYCGRRGCVERYVSGAAIQRRYTEISGERLPVEEIISRARRNDPLCVELLEEFLDRLAFSLANVIAILDPDVIVVGGGLSNLEELYSDGVLRVSEIVFNDSFATPIVKNKLGDASGVLGAALLGA